MLPQAKIILDASVAYTTAYCFSYLLLRDDSIQGITQQNQGQILSCWRCPWQHQVQIVVVHWMPESQCAKTLHSYQHNAGTFGIIP